MKGCKEDLKLEINHKIYIDGSWNQKKNDENIEGKVIDIELWWWPRDITKDKFEDEVTYMTKKVNKIFNKYKNTLTTKQIFTIIKTRSELKINLEPFCYRHTFTFVNNKDIKTKHELLSLIELMKYEIFDFSNM